MEKVIICGLECHITKRGEVVSINGLSVTESHDWGGMYENTSYKRGAVETLIDEGLVAETGDGFFSKVYPEMGTVLGHTDRGSNQPFNNIESNTVYVFAPSEFWKTATWAEKLAYYRSQEEAEAKVERQAVFRSYMAEFKGKLNRQELNLMTKKCKDFSLREKSEAIDLYLKYKPLYEVIPQGFQELGGWLFERGVKTQKEALRVCQFWGIPEGFAYRLGKYAWFMCLMMMEKK